MKSSTLTATTSLMTAALLLIGASSPGEARAQLSNPGEDINSVVTVGGGHSIVQPPILVPVSKPTTVLVDPGKLGLPTPPKDDPGPDQGDRYDDMRNWAMTVPVIFSSGSWGQVEKPIVVACDGPADKSYSGPSPSVIRVLNSEGEPIRQRRIANPRIVLPEEPREKWRLAERAELNLTVGLGRDAAAIAFYEDMRQKEPSLVVDLRREVVEAQQLAQKFRPGCQANNPPAVPIGDGGRFVLAYALQHASKSSDIPSDRLVDLMVEYGDDFGEFAMKQKLLKPTVVDLLDDATVQR